MSYHKNCLKEQFGASSKQKLKNKINPQGEGKTMAQAATLSVRRLFTKPKTKAYDSLSWTKRDSLITNPGTGKPVFDFNRYLNETLGGARPRNVHIQLGINDAFSLDPDAPDFSQQLGAIISHAETLMAGIRGALPDSIITVGSVIQANASDRAFIESYPQAPQIQSEWRWRRV